MGAQGLVSKEKIRGQYDGTCAPALPARCSLFFLQGDGWQLAMQSLPDACGVDSTCLAANACRPNGSQQRGVRHPIWGCGNLCVCVGVAARY